MQTLRRISLIAFLISIVLAVTFPMGTAQGSVAPVQGRSELIIIYVPRLDWDSLNAVDAPTLYQLAEASALANLNAPHNDLRNSVLEESAITLFCLDEADSLSQHDREVAELLNTINDQQVVVVVGASAFSTSGASYDLTPAIIHGEGFSGYVSSETTHRFGLITGSDLIVFSRYLHAQQSAEQNILQRNTEQKNQQGVQHNDQRADENHSILVSSPGPDSFEVRIAELSQKADVFKAVQDSKPTVIFSFLFLVFASFGVSLLLLIIGRRNKKGSRGLLVPLVRILWLIVLSYPLATFLMFIAIPLEPTGLDLVLIMIVWVAVISLIALFVGYYTKWLYSLFFLLLCSILVIAVGQIFGGPLNEPGYLTYDITAGARYYGMSNEHGAVLFGSWFVFSGLLINRFPDSVGVAVFKRWGFLLGSVLLLYIAVSPWLGASFGPLVWASFGIFLLWWHFNGHRLRWWVYLLALVISAVLSIGVLCLDIQFNPYSHMSEYHYLFNENIFMMLLGVVQVSWQASSFTIVTYMPLPAILFSFGIVGFFIVLRLFRPGTYREFWGRNRAYSSIYITGFLIAFLMIILEDSGFFTPAVFLIYPISGFVWLVCDMHRWHMNELEESKEPITIKQLLRRAIELETYRSSFSLPSQTDDLQANDDTIVSIHAQKPEQQS